MTNDPARDPLRPPSSFEPPPETVVDRDRTVRDPLTDSRSDSSPPGQMAGKYLLREKIGSGGMGEVWKAWDSELSRWVALKFLKGDDPEEVARFRREAEVAGGLSHPNIAAIHGVGEESGRRYIAMEFVEGRTLRGFTGTPREAAAFVRDAASAVAYAHERGVIHRDLKPENLMVSGDAAASRRLYVMDFGLARPAEGVSTLSVTGTVLGTPQYMSPEQARGSVLDARTDVYSLGATLYELLTGKAPVSGPNVYEILKNVQESEPEPPRRTARGIDKDLETIVLKCLEKDPSRRYDSASALAADLGRWMESEPILAHPPSTLYRLRKALAKRKAAVALGFLGAAFLGTLVVLAVRDRLDGERRDRARVRLEASRKALDLMRHWKRERVCSGRELLAFIDEKIRPELDAVLAEAPEDPEALLEFSRAHEEARDIDRAVAYADRAIRASPRFASARLQRVRLKVGDYEALSHEPDGKLSPGAAERAAALRKEIDEDFRRLKETSTDRVELLYGQALVAFSEQDFEKAQELLTEYLAGNPGDGQGHCWRGHALFHLDRYAESEEAQSRAIAADRGLVGAILYRGSARLELGKFAEAEADYGEGIRMAADPGRGYISRGHLRRDRGNDAGALEDYLEAAKYPSVAANAQHSMAGLRLKAGDYEGALEKFTEALRLAPHRLEILVTRGTCLLRMKRVEEGLADYRRAVELEPDSSIGYMALAFYHVERGNPDLAMPDIEKALQLDPKQSQVWYLRGKAHRIAERLDRALEDLDQATRLEARHQGAWFERGIVLVKQARYREAVDSFTKALELNPQDCAALLNRGTAREHLGDLAGAVKDFERAVAVSPPEWPYREPTRARIDALKRRPPKEF